MPCKGICKNYKATKPHNIATRYGSGQKRCTTCDIFVKYDGVYYPCCNVMLRTKPKGAKTRQKLMIAQQVNRF